MKIAHLCYGTPGDRGGGGHVYAKQNMRALVELGHEVHSIIAAPQRPVDDELEAMLHSVSYVDAIPPSPRSLDRVLARVFRQETALLRFDDWQGLASQFRTIVGRLGPDALWADWIGALALAPRGLPTVYGHLDFIHLLKPVREKLQRRKLRRPDAFTLRGLREHEFRLCKRALHVASVSATDLPLFHDLDVPATYIPVAGDDSVSPKDDIGATARAFFFGRNNTAMKACRHTFRSEIYPRLPSPLPLELHQVGDPPANPDDDWNWVAEHFVGHGFVDDLAQVFRPGDLCMVPYRDDTGFRAKFVTSASHGVVNIAFTESYDSAPEFVPGENCLAADSPEHFARLMVDYANDPDQRARMARASRALFEEHFTLQSLLPKYQRVLESCGQGAESHDET